MEIHIQNRQKLIRLKIAAIRKTIRAILKELGLTNSEVSFLFVDDSEIRTYNKAYLKRDRPTDVIAFPQLPSGQAPNPEKRLLGDVVISVERAKEQAKVYGKTLRDELKLLMTHGILHLIGYGDTTPKEKRKMRKIQSQILGRLSNL